MKVVLYSLFLASLGFLAGGQLGHIFAGNAFEYSKPKPVIVTRVVYRTKIVYRTSHDLNADRYKALQLCRGDNGAPTLVFFWYTPSNWETLCAGGHEAYTDGGVRLAAPK